MAFRSFAKRDLVIASFGALLWVADRSLRARRATGGAATAVGVAAGAAGAVVAFLAHEWGHLAGALGSGGVAHPPASLASPFLFQFDVDESTAAQFVWMSLGGFAATAVAASLIHGLAPKAAISGRVARGLANAGLIVTAVAELPPFFRVLAGGPLPTGFVYRSAQGPGASQ